MVLSPELEAFAGKRAARKAVVEAIAATRHFSMDELLSNLHAKAPKVSRLTIYRTLRAMRESSLLRETVLLSGARVYQLASFKGGMLWICDDCLRICGSPLTEVEAHFIAAAKASGFTAEKIDIEIYFRCEQMRSYGVCSVSHMS
jgi:Fe2+ or Zn2+ uptake regulation protein